MSEEQDAREHELEVIWVYIDPQRFIDVLCERQLREEWGVFSNAPLQQGRRNRFLHSGHPLTSLRSKWDQCWGGGVLSLTYRESNHPSALGQHSPLGFLRLHPKHAIHSRRPTQVHKFSCWGPEGMAAHHFHWLGGHLAAKTMCEREWLTRLLDVVNGTWIQKVQFTSRLLTLATPNHKVENVTLMRFHYFL